MLRLFSSEDILNKDVNLIRLVAKLRKTIAKTREFFFFFAKTPQQCSLLP
jgi:hypothetical protein